MGSILKECSVFEIAVHFTNESYNNFARIITEKPILTRADALEIIRVREDGSNQFYMESYGLRFYTIEEFRYAYIVVPDTDEATPTTMKKDAGISTESLLNRRINALETALILCLARMPDDIANMEAKERARFLLDNRAMSAPGSVK
jgi:hypothetical protein